MQYGTMKTEIWSHMKDVAQSYYHFEIITSWWQTENEDTSWKHSIIRIDRDGTIRDALINEDWNRVYRESVLAYMADQPTSYKKGNYVKGRNLIADQHQWLVRMVMG